MTWNQISLNESKVEHCCVCGTNFLTSFPNPALRFSIPTASVEPTFVRVPDTYQQDITFTCTGEVLRMLVVDKEIAWLVDGTKTTSGVGPTSNPKGMSSTSELQTLTPSNNGTYNYTCIVIVAVVGDPVLQDFATALVNVAGEHDIASRVWINKCAC